MYEEMKQFFIKNTDFSLTQFPLEQKADLSMIILCYNWLFLVIKTKDNTLNW